ncbi:virion protein [Mycobacterium phage Weirdo19]|uniref:Virion protein n=1 Tax=Mycobacterium phage Weirdo19 TaxID=2601610 RepID=A0A6M2YSW3_9CAUD|nr:tail protein [Mycobacterium phage Weirdo19]QEA10800.1 virion protein [Mycobacterium phage Weirdo19]
MADLAGLPWFQLTGHYRGVVPDTLDVGMSPDAFRPWGEVVLTPLVADTAGRLDPGVPELRLTDYTPPMTVLLTRAVARIETGVLRLPRDNAPAGETDPPTQGDIDEQRNSEGVPLLANSAALQLPEGSRLVWRVEFGPITILGNTYRYTGFHFEAPTITDHEAPEWEPPIVDLTTVARFTPAP